MAAPSATLLSLLPPMFFWHFIGWVRPLLCDILLWFLLVRALRPSRTWRILLAVLLALDAAQAPILSYLGDSYLMPDLPGPLYAALKLLRGFALLFFLEAILLWPILALARRLRRPPAPSPRPARRLALALLLANAALLATAFANAVVPPRTAVRELPVVGLPPDLDGYRILHLSDLHADPIAGAWRTRAIVRRANETAPDLVCITGDFADGSCARFAPALAPLADLRAPDGLYACTGNHEYYPPSVHSGWPAFFADLGIRFP
ncbi:MAG: metallophosphoesterase, partial [Kiritimatiellae bacterium]|nr:metallophosphoesterase [Kiritimatiellia bacterium]